MAELNRNGWPNNFGISGRIQSEYSNLALMKISAWHKSRGDKVEWFNSLAGGYDKVYSSKIFTWTKSDPYLPEDAICGGTGFFNNPTSTAKNLPDEIEHICPDYSLYNCDKSYGFLTRGCIRDCPWCFVPKKEGKIRANADIDEFVRHKHVVLMDNNVISHPHGIEQIEKIAKRGLTIDFNQGLDARLIDNSMAKLLSQVKWSPTIRLACDSVAMIDPIRKAVEALRWNNVTPSRYFCYVLVKDIDDALERIKFLKSMYIDPFCQPYRDQEGTEPGKEQRDFARWVNHKAVFKTTTWADYKRAA